MKDKNVYQEFHHSIVYIVKTIVTMLWYKPIVSYLAFGSLLSIILNSFYAHMFHRCFICESQIQDGMLW
jgi:hypothetical protein